MNLNFPLPVIPPGSEIMTQFQIAGLDIFWYATPTKPTGVIQMTRPDGSQPVPNGFSGLPINVPWGLNIDGRDDVWFGNFLGRGVILMAGENTKGHPAGTKTGDVSAGSGRQHPDAHGRSTRPATSGPRTTGISRIVVAYDRPVRHRHGGGSRSRSSTASPPGEIALIGTNG
jgi:hypothetical protein